MQMFSVGVGRGGRGEWSCATGFFDVARNDRKGMEKTLRWQLLGNPISRVAECSGGGHHCSWADFGRHHLFHHLA